jgi:invasion protein IalB
MSTFFLRITAAKIRQLVGKDKEFCKTKQNVIEEKEEKEVLVYDISYI